MLTQRKFNPFAPPVLNGVSETIDNDGYVSVDGNYIFNYFNVDAVEVLANSVPINTDSDFHLRGISILTSSEAANQLPPGFLVRIYTSDKYYLNSSYIDVTAFYQGNSTTPFVIFPQLKFKAGSQIMIDVNNTNGTTAIQILFRGVKRYKAVNDCA